MEKENFKIISIGAQSSFFLDIGMIALGCYLMFQSFIYLSGVAFVLMTIAGFGIALNSAIALFRSH